MSGHQNANPLKFPVNHQGMGIFLWKSNPFRIYYVELLKQRCPDSPDNFIKFTDLLCT